MTNNAPSYITSEEAKLSGAGKTSVTATPSAVPTSTSTSTSTSISTAAADSNSVVGQKCNTCGGHFRDAAAYRNHFRYAHNNAKSNYIMPF